MNCGYCYEKNKKLQSVSYEILDRIVDFIVEQQSRSDDKELSVVTHGGEPLIEFGKIQYFIANLNARIDDVKYIITTNATLLTEESIDFLTKNYSEISISIDGIQTTHDANRVFTDNKGTYDIVVRNAQKLLAERDDVKARMTINRKTSSTFYISVKHLLDIGFTTIVPVIDSYCNEWTESDMLKLFEEGKLIADYVKNSSRYVNVGFVDDALSKMKNAPCSGGTNTFSIDTDGIIYPCIVTAGMEDYAIGDVWNGIKTDKVKEIIEWDKIEMAECRGCSRYDYCTATRCRLINKIMTGDIDKPSPIVCGIENLKVDISKYFMEIAPSF